MTEFLQGTWEILGTELFKIGETPISVSTLATILITLIVTVWVSRTVRRVVEQVLTRRGGRPGVVGSVSGLIHYTILATGLGVALGTAGINLNSLFAAGAIFAVGLGFAMQSIAQNFVAGVILITERSIKPGDVLEVDGSVVRIAEMGIRATTAKSRDGDDLLIPNSVLIQTTVKNFTLKDALYRIRIRVGVVYRSDMVVVKETLARAARTVSGKWAVRGRDPQVILVDFGEHSVNWEVGIWMDNPWEWRQAISDLNEAVWNAFKENEITIAFPQLDVHFDPPLEDSIQRLAGPVAA